MKELLVLRDLCFELGFAYGEHPLPLSDLITWLDTEGRKQPRVVDFHKQLGLDLATMNRVALSRAWDCKAMDFLDECGHEHELWQRFFVQPHKPSDRRPAC